MAPFIAGRGGRSAQVRSSMASAVGGRRGTGDDASLQATSWRCCSSRSWVKRWAEATAMLTRACRPVARRVDDDECHVAPAVKRWCLRVSWSSGVSTGERSRRVEARGVGKRHALARPARSSCAHWRVHGHAWTPLDTMRSSRCDAIFRRGSV
jgi:hypothetical protein